MCVIKMSSSMQNFMEAYAAVHNTEAREELSSNRDLISEMDVSHLTSNDLLEIAEQVLEVAFETLTVQEAHEVITSMLSEETEIAGRAHKTDRLLEGFNKAFAEVGSKAASVALEHFAQYRHNKKLQETWTSRFNQEKRVQRVHGRQVAEDVASVKAKLLALLELYKGKHGQSEKEYQDGRSMAGKMISGDSKGSGANYSYRAKNTGPNPAGGSKRPQGQARMGQKDREYLKYQKANLKKEEVEQIEEKKGNMKAARANVGASTCWDGYKAKGTKMKNGRQVPNCVKEDELLEKAGKDYDGDGKVESGAKEYRGVIHNKIQQKKGGKADGKDTSSVKEGYGTGAAMIRGGGKPKKKVDVFAHERKMGKKTLPDGRPLPPAPKNEGVAFSQKELDAFEAIVNSWED